MAFRLIDKEKYIEFFCEDELEEFLRASKKNLYFEKMKNNKGQENDRKAKITK